MENRRPDWFYIQSGVIPFWIQEGRLEVMLITTIRSKRWIIPKGIVEPGLSPAVSATVEAEEEAGIRGNVSDLPLGSYQREKWGGTCTVQVFPMEVTEVLDTWIEDHLRDRQWLSPQEAAARVEETDLKAMILKIPDHIKPG